MFKKNLSILFASLAIVVIAAPSFALAGNYESSHRDGNRWGSVNEFGVRVFGDNKKEDKAKHRGFGDFFPGKFYAGTVTEVSGSNIEIKTKNDVILTVDADSAKVIQIPKKTIAIADIKVGDKVHVTGTRDGNSVDATVIYNMPQNLKGASAKGKVTAVSGDTITVETKAGTKDLKVETDSETTIVNQNHEQVELSEIEVGQRIGIHGLWDSTLNVLNAIKIKIWS